MKISDKNASIRVKKARAVLEEIEERFQLSQEKEQEAHAVLIPKSAMEDTKFI